MMKRSLKASTTGITTIKRAIQGKGWTQEYLAIQAGLSTRNSVWKFLSGRNIDRAIFMELCFQLDLDWQEIADLPLVSAAIESDIDILVRSTRLRLQESIQAQCGQLRSIFNTTKPLPLAAIYTDLQFRSYLSHQRWLEVADLQGQGPDFDRFRLNQIDNKTIPALETVTSHAKLVLLGKPGSGKTTFLKYLALQCLDGRFKGDCIPVFISLRTWAAETNNTEDLSLANYITSLWTRHDISIEQTETLLQQGKVLVLLNGLDEIPQTESETVIQHIQCFTKTYDRNSIVITCRLAAQAYRFYDFTYVEIADFNSDQIACFVQRWFTRDDPSAEGNQKAVQFLDQLKRSENQAIRELASTPILLSLICSVFQERAKFPNKRSKLYQEGLEILLTKWDRARGIKRDEIYSNLPLSNKLKLLGDIAAITFDRGHYFFEKDEVLSIIVDYLASLPNASSDPETLWLDSEAILQSIEVQHGLLIERAKGIYSFSHLTFQEYLTARKIVTGVNPDALDSSLQRLASHAPDERWREVILLTASMLANPESLLEQIESTIESLSRTEPRLQEFLRYLDRKVNSIQFPYHPSAVHAFYFSLLYHQDFSLAIALDRQLVGDVSGDLALDLVLCRALAMSATLLETPELDRILDLGFTLDIERRFPLTPEFARSLHLLKQQLPPLSVGKEALCHWWRSQGKDWVEQLRKVLSEHRFLGQDWGFSPSQQRYLQQYYHVNQLWVECGGNLDRATARTIHGEIRDLARPIERG